VPNISGNYICLWIWLTQVAHTKSRSKHYVGASKGPINQAFGKNHHRYDHGLRTKKVVAMRKMLAEMDKSLEDARIK